MKPGLLSAQLLEQCFKERISFRDLSSFVSGPRLQLHDLSVIVTSCCLKYKMAGKSSVGVLFLHSLVEKSAAGFTGMSRTDRMVGDGVGKAAGIHVRSDRALAAIDQQSLLRI